MRSCPRALPRPWPGQGVRDSDVANILYRRVAVSAGLYRIISFWPIEQDNIVLGRMRRTCRVDAGAVCKETQTDRQTDRQPNLPAQLGC